MTVEDRTNGHAVHYSSSSLLDTRHSASSSFSSFSSTCNPSLTTNPPRSSSSMKVDGYNHSLESNGWNWFQTCDEKFLTEYLRNFNNDIVVGQRGSVHRSRPPTTALPRPPSLVLLEDVIMPSVGQCCVDNGSTSLKMRNITPKSLTLLACIDESISFLSETYNTV